MTVTTHYGRTVFVLSIREVIMTVKTHYDSFFQNQDELRQMRKAVLPT